MGTNAYTDVHHTAYTLTTAGSWRRRPGTRMGFRILLLHVLSSGRTPLTIPQRARKRRQAGHPVRPKAVAIRVPRAAAGR